MIHKRALNKATIALICIFIAGCASLQEEAMDIEQSSTTIEFKGNPGVKKSIFVFLDGTANDTSSETNVVRLYRLIANGKDKQVVAKYIQGVGTVENPEFKSSIFFGLTFGQGMESRIKSGYDFIAKNYSFGDDIYIFGFSRGAHTARSLAGFVSYVGLPVKAEKIANFGVVEWNKILEITKGKNDSDYSAYWKSWTPDKSPPLANDARKALEVDFRPAQITFLGVWDTVPGSSFKKFGSCKELPDRKKGDRYKSDSYPPIRAIAHAVSMDEKRNKFSPLLLCPALYPSDTNLRPNLTEKWFPGAHADVGGGYSDGKNDLPNISLNWMIEALAQKYSFPIKPLKFPENPAGLAHWSIGDMDKVPGMRCEDRPVPTGDAQHESVRLRVGSPPIRVKGKEKKFPYPIQCVNEQQLIAAP